MSELKPGHYGAKVISYGITKTKNGDPQMLIQFQIIAEDRTSHLLTWYGSFKDNARPYTIDALLRCGLKVDNLAVLADGISSGALDLSKELSLDIRKEKGQDGKERLKIAWINEVRGTAFKAMVPKIEAISLLQGLEADVAKRRAETGIKKTTEEDDLGF